jgi:type VI secretion system protein ImpA
MDNDDLEGRAAVLEWLDDKISDKISLLPFSKGSDGNTFSYADWHGAQALDKLQKLNPELFQQSVQEGKRTSRELLRLIASMDLAICEKLSAEANTAQNELLTFKDVVDLKFGREAPSLRKLQNTIHDCIEIIQSIIQQKQEGAYGNSTAEKIVGHEWITNPNVLRNNQLKDRVDAIRCLVAAADYFRRNGPHSPVPYAVDRAIRWAEMPFDEWLRDVIRNADVLADIRHNLGIQRPDEGSNGS